MNSLLRDIMFMFIVIVISNIIVDITGEEKRYLTQPIRFFGIAFILSVIGGYGLNWINKISDRKQNRKKDNE